MIGWCLLPTALLSTKVLDLRWFRRLTSRLRRPTWTVFLGAKIWEWFHMAALAVIIFWLFHEPLALVLVFDWLFKLLTLFYSPLVLEYDQLLSTRTKVRWIVAAILSGQTFDCEFQVDSIVFFFWISCERVFVCWFPAESSCTRKTKYNKIVDVATELEI